MSLVESGQVSGQEAYQQANNKARFQSVRDDVGSSGTFGRDPS